MTTLVYGELGLQVRSGSALAMVMERELPVGPAEIEVVCAWCAAADAPAGKEPFADSVASASQDPRGAVAPLSHGICPACAEAMRAEYTLSVKRIPNR